MLSRRKLSAAWAALFPMAAAVPAFGGFTVTDHSITATGATVNETAPFAVFSSDDATTRLAGGATFTAGGSSSTLKFNAAGAVTAKAGDDLKVSYDFTVDLSAGTATPSVTGSFTQPLPFPLPPLTLTGSSNGSPVGPGPLTKTYQGTFDSGAIPIDINGTYTVALSVAWTGTAAGDTLSVTIPQHSIDLQVVSAPEPSCVALGLLAMPLAIRRRRR